MTNNSLVVIPFNLPWEWSTDYTNQTAYELAKRGNTVICYMWSEKYSIREYIRLKRELRVVNKIKKNLYVYYPILYIPFRRYSAILKLNDHLNQLILKTFLRMLILKNKFKCKLLWIFDPRLQPLTGSFRREWKVIFDCVDYFAASSDKQSEIKDLLKKEKRLVKSADLVVANSMVLQKYLEKYGKAVELVPQGFRVDDFKKDRKRKVEIIKRPGRPLIGYVGAINYRLDYKLLYDLAVNNQNWDFAIWGPVFEKKLLSRESYKYLSKLKKLPNLIVGNSLKKDIPGIINQFDVGVIPYDIKNKFNEYSYPMKIFEYFYLGKPIVSTDIIELKRFPDIISIGNNSEQWQKIISKTLLSKWPDEKRKFQKRMAEENSWSKKVNQILSYIK